ncbi:MAG: hypothetical protein ACM3OC_07500 [Deltaproteobacteria bacterium]
MRDTAKERRTRARYRERIRAHETVNVMEKGLLYFFYRPKVMPAGAQAHPHGLQDVQRLYMIMHPRQPKGSFRLIIVGHKKMPLPSVRGHKRFWGFIDDVSPNAVRIQQDTGGNVHATKTRGVERQPVARPAGEGEYELLRHGDHTHLVFKLDLPVKRGPVQEVLRIEDQASYIISVKNPDQPSPRGMRFGSRRKPQYPSQLKAKFRTLKFIDADPVQLLDYPGTQFVLISASARPQKELGIKIETESEKAAEQELFKDLGLEKGKRPLAPILTGQWE